MMHKIDRILISVDDNPLYIQFLPLFSLAWQKLLNVKPTLAYVTDLPREEWEWMDKYCQEIIHFPTDNSLPSGKCRTFAARMLMRYREPELISMISDIDMIPMNGEYFENILSNYDRHMFVSSGYNAYEFGDGDPKSSIKDPKIRKFPSCYTIATGSVWKEIVNPDNLTDESLINSWRKIRYYDYKESVDDPNFDDESLMRALIQRWNPNREKVVGINRNIVRTGFMSDRLDRSNWRFNADMLRSGRYIDAHCPRPIEKYKQSMQMIADYLEVPLIIGDKNA